MGHDFKEGDGLLNKQSESFPINKQIIFLFLLIAYLMSLQSVGYDLYAHSVQHYFKYQFEIDSYLILGFYFPRYLLLSYLYGINNITGIPFGFIPLILTFYASKILVKQNNSTVSNSKFYFSLIIICTYFYSAISLSILWILAYRKSNKKRLLLGFFFHPSGLVLMIIFYFFERRISFSHLLFIKAIFLVIIFLGYVNINFYHFLNFSIESPKYEINFEDIIPSFVFAVKSKYIEICALIAILVLSKFKFLTKLSSVKVGFLYPLAILFCFGILTQNAISRDRASLISPFVDGTVEPNIIITWMGTDFYHRESFDNINSLRFE